MSPSERTAEFPVATTPAPGVMGVDWEQRVDFERLRRYRLERARRALEASDLGALLVFDTANIRYLTATHIGYWAFNKMERWALLTRTGEPWIWDFGSAARVHKLQAPWLDPTHSVGGNTGLAGSIGPESGLVARAVREIRDVLEDEGVAEHAPRCRHGRDGVVPRADPRRHRGTQRTAGDAAELARSRATTRSSC